MIISMENSLMTYGDMLAEPWCKFGGLIDSAPVVMIGYHQ